MLTRPRVLFTASFGARLDRHPRSELYARKHGSRGKLDVSQGSRFLGLKSAKPAQNPSQPLKARVPAFNTMKVLKPRSRMISIRLSEEEYDGLCRLSAVTGAHSLSDLARNAMRLFLSLTAHERLLTDPTGAVQAQMEILNRRIDELRNQLLSPERPMAR